MATGVEIGTLIERDRAIRGGRPKIAGTGLTVRRIVGWYKKGMSPEEIALEYPHLSLAQVHAALRQVTDLAVPLSRLAAFRNQQYVIDCGA
jgi:uncharacterized protein (DUF433 family)